jgi:hypothetical protein
MFTFTERARRSSSNSSKISMLGQTDLMMVLDLPSLEMAISSSKDGYPREPEITNLLLEHLEITKQ